VSTLPGFVGVKARAAFLWAWLARLGRAVSGYPRDVMLAANCTRDDVAKSSGAFPRGALHDSSRSQRRGALPFPFFKQICLSSKPDPLPAVIAACSLRTTRRFNLRRAGFPAAGRRTPSPDSRPE